MMMKGCNCDMLTAVGGTAVFSIGAFLAVVGFAMQWRAADPMVWWPVLGYYFAGFFLIMLGKVLKHQAGCNCKIHGGH